MNNQILEDVVNIIIHKVAKIDFNQSNTNAHGFERIIVVMTLISGRYSQLEMTHWETTFL